MIKDKLIDLIERTFNRERSSYLACNDRNAFFTLEKPENIMHGLVKMYVTFCWTTFFIPFGTKLYRQVVGIPMGTNCAPLVADFFLFCYMMSLSDDKQADSIEAFNNTSRYLDDSLNINNVYFDNMVSQIPVYPSELPLNKANTSDTEAAFLDLHLMILLPKFMINVTILIFKLSISILDGDVPRSTSYGVYISRLIRFARASSHAADFITRNTLITQKLSIS